MKRELRSKSVGTKVSEAELRVLESRAERAGLTLSEWVRDVLLGSSVEMGTLAAERAILAEVLAMRTILLNFMLKVGEGNPVPAIRPASNQWPLRFRFHWEMILVVKGPVLVTVSASQPVRIEFPRGSRRARRERDGWAAQQDSGGARLSIRR